MATVLAQAQTGPLADEKHLSKPKFRIPVALQAEKVASLQGVLLYVSNNRGKSWELHGRIKPDEGSFQYLAKSDGVYWFKVAVLDKQGNQDPRDIYQAEDCMKIVVDSLPPEVKLTAEKQDSSIQVRWNIREDNPELATMKLEARIPGGDAWLPVQIKPGLSGSGTLQVPQPGPVELRLSLADRAGNLGLGEAQVGMDGQPKPGLPVLNAGVPGALVSKPAGEPGTVPGAVVPVAGPTNPPAAPPWDSFGFSHGFRNSTGSGGSPSSKPEYSRTCSSSLSGTVSRCLANRTRRPYSAPASHASANGGGWDSSWEFEHFATFLVRECGNA